MKIEIEGNLSDLQVIELTAYFNEYFKTDLNFSIDIGNFVWEEK